MLNIDDFLARLNRRGTLNPVSENTRKAYRNSLGQFQRFLDGRQPTQELAQEWIQQLLDKGRKPAALCMYLSIYAGSGGRPAGPGAAPPPRSARNCLEVVQSDVN